MRLNSKSKILSLTLLSSLLLFSYLGRMALIDPDEGRYSEGSREMLVLKDYVIPHLNFKPRINKPGLFYWLTVISYKAFGINEFSARFPSALFGLILILGTYLWTHKEIGERKAYLSSLILLGTPAIFIASRIAITDIVFTSFVIFSLFSFWSSHKNKRLAILGYFFLGLSLATKGPAGFVIVILTLVVFSLWKRDKIYILRALNPWGILIFLIVGGLWYLALLNKIGWLEFKHFVFQETWGRLGEGFVHRKSLYYYLPLVIGGFLPWSIFLLGFRKLDLKDNLIKFLVTFTLVTLFFFSICKTKLPTYILPIFPALAVIDANIMDRYWGTRRKEILFFLLFMALGAILIPLSFPSRLLKLVDITALYKLSAFILLISLPFIFLIRFRLKRQFIYLFSVFFSIYFYLILNFAGPFSVYRSTKKLFAGHEIDADVIYALRFFKPSLVFYSKKKIHEIDNLSEFKQGYLIIKKKDIEDVRKRLTKPFQIISETDKYLLIKTGEI